MRAEPFALGWGGGARVGESAQASIAPQSTAAGARLSPPLPAWTPLLREEEMPLSTVMCLILRISLASSLMGPGFTSNPNTIPAERCGFPFCTIRLSTTNEHHLYQP